MPVVVFPDAEAVVTGYLRDVLDPAVHVGTEWPQQLLDQLAGGVVSVSRGGGATRLRLVLDEPTIDIDVLAADKAAAHDIAQLVRGHMVAAEGRTIGGARIYRVDDVSLSWLPWLADDATAPIPRYVLVMNLRIRPA